MGLNTSWKMIKEKKIKNASKYNYFKLNLNQNVDEIYTKVDVIQFLENVCYQQK